MLKESTEAREVAVPPLALTADGRAIGEAPVEAGSSMTSPRELALALALQVISKLIASAKGRCLPCMLRHQTRRKRMLVCGGANNL